MDENVSKSDIDVLVAYCALPRKPRLVTLEPAVFLLFLSYSLSSTILQNQILYQTCTVTFGFNSSDCLHLGTANASMDIELVVQPYTSTILVVRTIIESVLPGILSLFIGPWSDRFGRKPVIVATFVGSFFVFLILMTVAWISSVFMVSPWWYILASFPIAITGGICALLTGIFCYVSDITTQNNRAMRMSLLECAVFVGILIGSISCSYVLKYTSTYASMGLAAFMTLFATLYLVFFVNESIQNIEADQRIGKMAKFGALFDMTLITDLFATVFKRRENYERAVVWLTIMSLTCSIIVLDGSGTVFYLFVQEKFHWSIQQYTMFDSASIVVQVVGSVFGLYVLAKLIGLSESTVAIMAYSCAVGDYTVKALATKPWHLYLASVIAILKSVASPMCRVILSKTVPQNEVGKVFALTTSIESISSLLSAPLYGMIYSHTIEFFPGAFNLVSAGFFVICVILLFLVRIFNRVSQTNTISYGPISE